MAISALPEYDEDLVEEEGEEEIEEDEPDTTWILNEDTKTIGALSDDRGACVTQAAKIALRVERQEYEMYDIDYGSTLHEMIGETRPHVYGEIEGAIRECLEGDDRIDDVDNFVFDDDKGNVTVTFDMIIDEDDIGMELEVDTNGD